MYLYLYIYIWEGFLFDVFSDRALRMVHVLRECTVFQPEKSGPFSSWYAPYYVCYEMSDYFVQCLNFGLLWPEPDIVLTCDDYASSLGGLNIVIASDSIRCSQI